MPNGKPGDHPITDLLLHRLAVYGEPLDSQLRELGALTSKDQLYALFDEHWNASKEELQAIVSTKLRELRGEAQEGG